MPQNPALFRFDDQQTVVYPGITPIGGVPLYQILSNMPPEFSVAENVSGAQFTKGQVIGRGPAARGYVLADNSALSNQAIGLCGDIAPVGVDAVVQLSGQFCLTDWTSVTGTPTLLPRTVYYLDATPGKLTSVAPVGPAILQRIGYSISPLVLNLNVEIVDGASGGGGSCTFSDLMLFNADTGLWYKVTVTGALGFEQITLSPGVATGFRPQLFDADTNLWYTVRVVGPLGFEQLQLDPGVP